MGTRGAETAQQPTQGPVDPSAKHSIHYLVSMRFALKQANKLVDNTMPTKGLRMLHMPGLGMSGGPRVERREGRERRDETREERRERREERKDRRGDNEERRNKDSGGGAGSQRS